MNRRLSNWIDSYLHFTRHDESPTQFHRWTAYTILAAAVNRNVWMGTRGYYKLFPNLYVLFIGSSGVGKSSSSSMGIEILRETTLKVNIYKDFITPPALMEFMSRSSVSTEFQFGGKTVITQKTPLLLYASELGNLLSLRSGIRELTLLLTELFNKQGDHEDTTNKRGTIKIKKPSVTFFACCVPEWIEEELISVSLRSGFLGRMLVVIGTTKRHRISRIQLTPEDFELRKDLIHDLEIIGANYGELKWSLEAGQKWDSWYNNQPLDMSIDDMEVAGFGSRREQFAQRLAMLSSIGRSNDLIVSEDDLKIGIAMVKYCENNIRSLGAKSEDHKAVQSVKRNLTSFCKRVPNSEIDMGMLMKRVSRWANKRKLDEILEQLSLEGFVNLRGRKVVICGPFDE